MENNKFTQGLGVAYSDFKTYLFYKTLYDEMPAGADDKGLFQVGMSRDGLGYGLINDSATIKTTGGKKEDIGKVSDFRISDFGNFYGLAYILDQGKKQSLCIAQSSDLVNWIKKSEIPEVNEVGMVVPAYKFENRFVLYFGGKAIRVAYSSDLKTWKVNKKPVFVPDKKDGPDILIGSVDVNAEGILVLFYQCKEGNVPDKYSVKAMLFDERNAEKSMWKSEKQIWDQIDDWTGQDISPFGVIKTDDKLISYWQAKEKRIFALSSSFYKTRFEHSKPSSAPLIKKFRKNPVLMPLIDNFWESKAVFNPAAFYDEGKVHIVYRAVGDNDVSTLGYASSLDGLKIDQRHKHPIYVPTQPFEGSQYMSMSHHSRAKIYKRLALSPYVSGIGYGGCEDPRITKLEGRIYMTYAAFNGYEQARSAFTSISVEDFHNGRWNWATPVLMTAKPTVWGTGGKNACFLSEKINGKYVIMHRFWPNIVVDYLDDLDFGEGKKFLRTGRLIQLPEDMWEKGRFSIGGAVPLETNSGWLLFYGTRSLIDADYYNMGVRLLDKKDTKKVLADYSNVNSVNCREFLESEGIITPRTHMWDSAKISIGAPPIKIDEGWLLIYQAVGYRDSSKYKIGAMILDVNNPAKVLHRSLKPTLEPDERYENEGHKSGIVYSCGAVVKDDELFIYYGGADTVTCVAHANLHEFLYQLKRGKSTEFGIAETHTYHPLNY